MRKLVKPALIASGVVLAGGILAVALVLYRTYFAHSSDVAIILASVPRGERDLPPAFKRAVARVHPQGVTPFVVMRLLGVVHRQPASHLRSRYRELVWTTLLPRTRTADEIMSLYAHFMVSETGRGLEPGAAYYFNKPVEQLTDREALSLVIIDLSPSAYSPRKHPEQLKAALARYAQ